MPNSSRFLVLWGLLAALLSLTACTGKGKTVTYIAINPIHPKIFYIATNDAVYKTRDGGKDWTKLSEGLGGARVISLAVHPQLPSTVYAGTMGDSVYRSMDGGQHWGIINAGMKEHVSVVNSMVFYPGEPDVFFAGTTVGVFKSTNGGLMWEDLPLEGMDSVYVVPMILDHDNPNIIYVGTSGGVYRSPNGGRTWERLFNGMITEKIEPGLSLGVNTLAQDPGTPDDLYAGTTRGAYKSVNRGKLWTKIAGGLPVTFIAQIIIDPDHAKVVYAGTSDGIFRSRDAGETWSPINQGLTGTNVRCLAMHPKDHKTIYAGSQHGLFRTTDGGDNWTKLPIVHQKPKNPA
jgi:photosystem II stability/assembly factor-like uncharacterized protein